MNLFDAADALDRDWLAGRTSFALKAPIKGGNQANLFGSCLAGRALKRAVNERWIGLTAASAQFPNQVATSF